MGGDHIEQRFKDAGFVDIKVTKENNYCGNWVGGFLFIFEVTKYD